MSFRKKLTTPCRLWEERPIPDTRAYEQKHLKQKSFNERRFLLKSLSLVAGFRCALCELIVSMRKGVAYSALSLLLMLPAYTDVLGGTPPGSPARGTVDVSGDEENTPPRGPHRRKPSRTSREKALPHVDGRVVGVKEREPHSRRRSGSPGREEAKGDALHSEALPVERHALRERNHGDGRAVAHAMERWQHTLPSHESPSEVELRKPRVSRSHSGSPTGSPGGEVEKDEAALRVMDELGLERVRRLAAVRYMGAKIRRDVDELEALRRGDHEGDGDGDEARSHMSARSGWTLQSRASVAADFEALLREKDGLLGDYQEKLRRGIDKYREEQKQRRAAEKEARRLKRELDALKEEHEKSRAETLKLVAQTLDRANGRRDRASERATTVDDTRSHTEREESRPDFAGVATHALLSRVGDLQAQMEEYLAKKIQHQIMVLQQSYVRTINPTSLADKIREISSLLDQIRHENSLLSGRATRGQRITQAEELLRAMAGSVDLTRASVHELERQIRDLEAQITEEPRALTSAKERLRPGEHLSSV